MVDKKAVIISTIISIILFGAIFGFKIYQFNKQEIFEETVEATEKAIISKKTETTKKTEKEEVLDKNNTNENHTEPKNSEIKENTIKEENKNDANTSKNNASEQEDLEETAISLVKEKWGKRNTNVYFSVDDETTDGKYIVSVRDNNSTTQIASYKVDVKNKKVEEN